MSQKNQLSRTLGTQHVVVAGISVVVAASTLVSDFTGYISIGAGFIIALLIAFGVNLLLGISAGKLASNYPKAGTIYNYARSVIGGQRGVYWGLLLGLTFYLMASFAIAGETLAGAFALKSLLGWEVNELYVVMMLFILALIPNLFSIKTTSWIAAILLLLMMGIRWAFGLTGLFNLSDAGQWNWANLASSEITLTGETGLISAGLALAIWSFIGIEFCGSLAEEVKEPSKTLPKGIFLGLVIILLTSLVMGTGVAGFLPQAEWQALIQSDLGCNGECPQLAIGQTMMGNTGFALMALGSVLATLSSLIVILAAMPRLLYGMTRDEGPPNGLSGWVKQINLSTGTPLNATLLTFCIYIIPPMFGDKVTDWIFSAAYIWLLIYACYHILRGMDAIKRKESKRVLWVPAIGLVGTIVSIYFSFDGAHQFFGLRALFIIGIAALATLGLKGKVRPVTKTILETVRK